MPEHTFPLDGAIDLHARIGHGSITVETADDLAEASVVVTAGKHGEDLLEQLVVRLEGRTLTVAAPRQGGIFDLPFLSRRGAIDVHITVPTATPVRISTFTAPITIVGTVGNADIAFGAAEAELRDVEGNLRLRFGNGTARVARVAGSVQMRAGSGSVRLGEVGGALDAGCGSGNLEVHVARGQVRSRCGSGSALLREVHGDVDVTSGSGGVEIGLPSGLSARLDVHSGTGRVQSEFPIDDAPTSPERAISLRARTGSGNVRLFRAA